MKDQTPLRKVPVSDKLGRKVGDWFRNLAIKHQGGGQELQDFMAHPDATNRTHRMINEMAREYRLTRPLRERRPLFSTVLGGYASKADLIKVVEEKGHQITDWAKGVTGGEEFVVLGTPERYDFFPATVKELTGKNRVTTTELYAALYHLGYCDAPDESALVIRMEYTDQPMDEWRSVLSKPRPAAGGGLDVLALARGANGSFVSRDCAGPADVWDGHVRLLVCRKCQPLAT